VTPNPHQNALDRRESARPIALLQADHFRRYCKIEAGGVKMDAVTPISGASALTGCHGYFPTSATRH
jgi:hypothetical protein